MSRSVEVGHQIYSQQEQYVRDTLEFEIDPFRIPDMILEVLVSNTHSLVTNSQLAEQVWGETQYLHETETNTLINTHLFKLRQSLNKKTRDYKIYRLPRQGLVFTHAYKDGTEVGIHLSEFDSVPNQYADAVLSLSTCTVTNGNNLQRNNLGSNEDTLFKCLANGNGDYLPYSRLQRSLFGFAGDTLQSSLRGAKSRLDNALPVGISIETINSNSYGEGAYCLVVASA